MRESQVPVLFGPDNERIRGTGQCGQCSPESSLVQQARHFTLYLCCYSTPCCVSIRTYMCTE